VKRACSISFWLFDGRSWWTGLWLLPSGADVGIHLPRKVIANGQQGEVKIECGIGDFVSRQDAERELNR
jgi:hypothetical protein